MAALEIGAALAAAQPLISDIYGKSKSELGGIFKKVQAKYLVRRLTARAQDISQVKTLLCLEQPVLITDFYSPQFISTPAGERVEVQSPDTLCDYPRMVLTGVAGQGKSICFRFLAIHEIARRKLPLFVELRNIEPGTGIVDLLLTEIDTLGFPKDLSVLTLLLESGSCVLYLDAFDEIPHNLQQKSRKQIEDIARKHVSCRIYVSSRPSLNIESSNYFRVARLDTLRPQEAKSALRNMCSEGDEIDKIETELEAANHRLSKLLTTPLMVALLLLHHRLSGEFPETEQAFFGDLFDVLLRRHDQTKGYIRVRQSTASEQELSELFGYLSFACRQQGVIEVDRSDMIKKCGEGAKFHDRDYDASGALADIVQGTNLVLEEGAYCRFAHKAIQEFYAARFLSGQPESALGRFFGNRVKNWGVWVQLLEFFELINPCLFYKHFLIPHAGWVAFEDTQKRIPHGWVPSKAAYKKVFGRDQLGIRRGKMYLFGPQHNSRFYPLRNRRFPTELVSNVVATIDWTKIADDESLEPATVDWVPFKEKLSDFRFFTLSYLLDLAVGDQFRECLLPFLQEGIREVNKCYNFIDYRIDQAEFFS